jgi:hypothetical protein
VADLEKRIVELFGQVVEGVIIYKKVGIHAILCINILSHVRKLFVSFAGIACARQDSMLGSLTCNLMALWSRVAMLICVSMDQASFKHGVPLCVGSHHPTCQQGIFLCVYV